jgi:hypothetical protein
VHERVVGIFSVAQLASLATLALGIACCSKGSFHPF